MGWPDIFGPTGCLDKAEKTTKKARVEMMACNFVFSQQLCMMDVRRLPSARRPAHPPQSDAADSLLSLSIAAASAAPVPLQSPPPTDSAPASLPDSLPSPPPVQISTSTGSSHKTHRRLASTGKRGRRLSDAREAASRPS
jgi:hypothetical protein